MNENIPLKQAAEAAGISDANYLSRLFKRHMGLTISEYKQHSVDYTFPFVDPKKVR